jgi:translation initiation factor 2B subunit (eIF-2B alpha/beta/delta family)
MELNHRSDLDNRPFLSVLETIKLCHNGNFCNYAQNTEYRRQSIKLSFFSSSPQHVCKSTWQVLSKVYDCQSWSFIALIVTNTRRCLTDKTKPVP